MKRSRFSDEQIIAIVKKQEAGTKTAAVVSSTHDECLNETLFTSLAPGRCAPHFAVGGATIG